MRALTSVDGPGFHVHACGYGITSLIESASNDVLRVEEGSLFPALHRLEERDGFERVG